MLGSGKEPGPIIEKNKLSIEKKSFIVKVPLPNKNERITILAMNYTKGHLSRVICNYMLLSYFAQSIIIRLHFGQ